MQSLVAQLYSHKCQASKAVFRYGYVMKHLFLLQNANHMAYRISEASSRTGTCFSKAVFKFISVEKAKAVTTRTFSSLYGNEST